MQVTQLSMFGEVLTLVSGDLPAEVLALPVARETCGVCGTVGVIRAFTSQAFWSPADRSEAETYLPCCEAECRSCVNVTGPDRDYSRCSECLHCEECCECWHCSSCCEPTRYATCDECDRCAHCCECQRCERCGNVADLCEECSYCWNCLERVGHPSYCDSRFGELVETRPYVAGAKSAAGHKFGVELEMTYPSPARALQILESVGLPIGSHYSDTSGWRAKCDGSVNGEDCEVVSPILCGADGLFQLEIALEALNANGARVDSSCGGHVHIDMTGSDGKDIAALLKLYRQSEAAIDRFLPADRRGSAGHRYCHSVQTRFHEELEEKLEQCETATQTDDTIYDYGRSRYYAVNVLAFTQHETVEFRSLEGCLNFSRLSAWILFLLALERGSKFGARPSSDLATLVETLRWYDLPRSAASELLKSVGVVA